MTLRKGREEQEDWEDREDQEVQANLTVLQSKLALHGITATGEVSLREALEARAETYTLIKLAPWPARRWKCRYRLLMGDDMYDAQSAAEAYALGLLALLLHAPGKINDAH